MLTYAGASLRPEERQEKQEQAEEKSGISMLRDKQNSLHYFVFCSCYLVSFFSGPLCF
jgi:hypothetical protein